MKIWRSKKQIYCTTTFPCPSLTPAESVLTTSKEIKIVEKRMVSAFLLLPFWLPLKSSLSICFLIRQASMFECF